MSPAPQTRPMRLEADPADVMMISAYWGNLTRYRVTDVWREDGQTLCQVEPASRDAFNPPDATIYRFTMAEAGAQFDEVQWVDGTSWATFDEMRQASLDHAAEQREAKVLAEFEAQEAKAVAEGAPSMVIPNVNAMRHKDAAAAVGQRLKQLMPDAVRLPLTLHRSRR